MATSAYFLEGIAPRRNSADPVVIELMRGLAWGAFSKRVAQQGLCGILDYTGFCEYEMGYLRLIESVLSNEKLLEICLLVLPIDEKFANEALPFMLQEHQNFLVRHEDALFSFYCRKQAQRAKEFWPNGIGVYIEEFIHDVLSARFPGLFSEAAWEYLCVRFGFGLGGKPIHDENRVSALVCEKFPAMECLERGILARQTEARFRDEEIYPFVETFAKMFFNSWLVPVRLNQERGGKSEEKTESFSTESLLQSYIAKLFSSRIVNPIETRYKGALKLKELLLKTENDLVKAPGVGQGTIRAILEKIKPFGLWLGMSDEKIKAWQRGNRNKRFTL